MNDFVDLTGKRFGKLIVLERSSQNNKYNQVMWICRCDCGKQSVVVRQSLRSGNTKSCGCVAKLKGNRYEDLTGHIFDRLTVQKDVGRSYGFVKWLCKCQCGNTSVVLSHALKSGNSRSCGCLQKEKIAQVGKNNTKHGHAPRSGASKEYNTWRGMITRCTNVKSIKYPRYGGRGIIVCSRWMESFDNFLNDMGQPPSPKHSLGRINNDGNYELSNCRWETAKEQARNRHNTAKIGDKSIIEYCEEYNLNYHTVMTRIQRGYSAEDAVSTPIHDRISKGAQHLFDIVKEIFPHQKIIREYNVADRGYLPLDFFIPSLNIAMEYDGEMHTIFSPLYHGDRAGFLAMKKRDSHKDERCEILGIILVRIAYSEEMSKELVLSKLEEALDG